MSATAHAVHEQIAPRAWRIRIQLRLILVLVVVSALAVIYTKHWNRKLFVELQELQHQRDQLNVEWGQLQLEQSAWATHIRVEQIARERLGLIQPPPDKVVVIRP
ncbi:MAG: cell division protein FtsL [Pseudomonadota bacterium]